MHKDIKEILISEQEIDSIVSNIAEKIDKDYENTDMPMVGLLKGSICFMADLMKKMKSDFKIDFVVASSYANGTESTGTVNIVKDVSQSVQGKDILIVEDIIDSGNTLDFMVKYFKAKKANSVKIATLLDKPERRKVKIDVDYVGKIIPDEFVVGYGLDYAEDYRTLPYIGILKESVYS